MEKWGWGRRGDWRKSGDGDEEGEEKEHGRDEHGLGGNCCNPFEIGNVDIKGFEELSRES